MADSIEAQSYQWGLMPGINLNKSIQNGWKINGKLESRVITRRFEEQEPIEQLTYNLTDLALMFNHKTFFEYSIAFGYLARFEKSKMVHRTILQISKTNQFSGWRLSHRYVADQTFANNESPQWRLRYRLTAEIPIVGEQVDVNEPYFKWQTEVLGKWKESDFKVELRSIPSLGYLITDHNKLEFNFDYRIDSIVDGAEKNKIWMCLKWYLTI